uniref:Uncharacterized protein n=1 Tax=Siphoviridae sp. ctdYc1 TaxID=2826399 RepID=A0A8S5N0D0_9CAUD|nr:MAG TPA: hypothetical protein [Siphoviridae sp. ctdYc1]
MRGVRVPDAPSLYAVIRLFSWSDYRIPKTSLHFQSLRTKRMMRELVEHMDHGEV